MDGSDGDGEGSHGTQIDGKWHAIAKMSQKVKFYICVGWGIRVLAQFLGDSNTSCGSPNLAGLRY